MEQSVASTQPFEVAQNLFDFAFDNYEEAEQSVDGFKDASPEDHFDILLHCLDNFLTAAETSDYLEDMEDSLAAVVGAAIAIAVSANLFTEPIETE